MQCIRTLGYEAKILLLALNRASKQANIKKTANRFNPVNETPEYIANRYAERALRMKGTF